MIACISPCDRDFAETRTTLEYANRTKNITNKVVANQDSQTQLLCEIQNRLAQMEQENNKVKMENEVLPKDVARLEQENRELRQSNNLVRLTR